MRVHSDDVTDTAPVVTITLKVDYTNTAQSSAFDRWTSGSAEGKSSANSSNKNLTQNGDPNNSELTGMSSDSGSIPYEIVAQALSGASGNWNISYSTGVQSAFGSAELKSHPDDRLKDDGAFGYGLVQFSNFRIIY